MPAELARYFYEDLVKQIKKGDKQAFNLLFERYAPFLYQVICKNIADTKAAEEVLQKVMVSIWDAMPHFNPNKEHLLGWMLTIMRHTIRNTVKSETDGNIVHTNESALNLIYKKGFSLNEAAEVLKMTVSDLKLRLRDEIKNAKIKK